MCPYPTVDDASETIKAKVAQKVEKSKLPPPIKPLVAKHAGQAASKLMTPSKIAKTMGAKMCKVLPKKMKEKGLTVELEEAFREGPYIVLQLQVLHVDAAAVEKSMREENADLTEDDEAAATNTIAGTLIEWSYKLIGAENQKKLEEGFLSAKVQAKLETAMAVMMAEKFEQKQLKAQIQILKEEKQARYFYGKIKEVRMIFAELEGNNPISDLRKNMNNNSLEEDDDDDDDF